MTEPDQQLHRSLRNRHIQLIALGGAIGTGLFYGAADSISAAGPAIVISYLVGGRGDLPHYACPRRDERPPPDVGRLQ